MCYFGDLASESFTKMGDVAYDANWPDISISLQKFIILIIGDTQQPLYYHGFGIALLNLETFSKVHINIIISQPFEMLLTFFLFQSVRAVASYYMAFKTLTE